jgi:hypothetical protein
LVQYYCKSKSLEKQYLIYKDFEKIGGNSLLLYYYKGSPSLLITSLFPEYQLLPWKFAVSTHHFWGKVENQRKYLDWAAEQLNVKEPSDWYKLGAKVVNYSYCYLTL